MMNDQKVIDTKLLYLSTKSSACIPLNGDKKSSVLFELKNYIDFSNDPSIEFVSISMPYAIITTSNYIINEDNNKFNFQYGVSEIDETLTFPVGNYTAQSFMKMIISIGTAFGLNIVISPTTNKFRIVMNEFFKIGVRPSSCDYIMGFSTNVISSFLLDTKYVIDMPRVCNFLPTATYNICSSSIYNGQVLGSYSNFSFANVLCSIPNTGRQNEQVVYQNINDEFVLNTNQNTLKIDILDDAGRFIDFQGIASFMSLRIRIHRKYGRIQGGFSDIVSRATQLNSLVSPAEEKIAEEIEPYAIRLNKILSPFEM